IMAGIAERSQRLITDFLNRNAANPAGAAHLGMADAMNIGAAFLDLTAKMLADPQKLMDAQLNLWRDTMELWRSAAMKVFSGESQPVVQPDPTDRRFKDEAWQQNQVFDFIKQSYLLTSRWLQDTVHGVD